ncbi:hypothetical protein DL98DRAFT_587135 [Cadophora sp. DSE1049]|nr:hypothetical protein DL98DRAFT_587135 [Cadophora sp. DSE1049]
MARTAHAFGGKGEKAKRNKARSATPVKKARKARKVVKSVAGKASDVKENPVVPAGAPQEIAGEMVVDSGESSVAVTAAHEVDTAPTETTQEVAGEKAGKVETSVDDVNGVNDDSDTLFLPTEKSVGEGSKVKKGGKGKKVAKKVKSLKDMSDKERRAEGTKLDAKKKVIDENHPLWPVYQNIPTGSGETLSNVELLILCRVPAEERHKRASKYFAKDKYSLIYRRYHPERSKKNLDKFDKFTRQDFKAAGITWADMPLFASGGTKKAKKDEILVDTKMGGVGEKSG